MSRIPTRLVRAAFLASLATPPQPAAAAPAAPVTIHTTSGPVSGLDDGTVTAWRGIPYAAPPVGALRFRPPAPAAPWSAPRDATRDGPPCPQTARLGTPSTDEACLTLDIFRPDRAGPRPPVLVFLFGGSFRWGAAGTGAPPAGPDYDGHRLAVATGAVIVTVNHRLGVLGFLALPALDATDPRHVSGNAGLLDQQQALRFVAANAAAFGLDPNRITLLGQSAGAVSVAEQIVSPGARGLFRAAVLASPGALPAATLASREVRDAPILARLGCDRAADPLACLDAVPVDRLLRSRVPVGPVIDGVVIPASPDTLLPRDAAPHAPVVLLTDADEGTYFVAAAIRVLGHAPDAAELARTLAAAFGPAAAETIEAAYRATAPNASPARLLATILTDEFFACPASRLHAGLTAARIPSVEMEFAVSHPVFDYPVPIVPDLDPGDAHTAELAAIFGQDGAGAPLPPGDEAAVSQAIGAALRLVTHDPADAASAAGDLDPRETLELAAPSSLDATFTDRHRCRFWAASAFHPRLIAHFSP